MATDRNGREIKVGDVVRRGVMRGDALVADKMHHLPIPQMCVLEILGDRNIRTDVKSNGELPPVYLASLCEVIS